MKRGFVIISILLITLLSCIRETETGDTGIKPSILKDIGYVVPPDSLQPPDTSLLKVSNVMISRISEPVALKANQKNIPVSLKISRMVTSTRRIGTGEFTNPRVINFKETSVSVGLPAQVLVKEPIYKEINPGSFFYYSKMQGLLHDQIRALAQDSIGNIWVGTDNGLTRYDGKYFYHFTQNQGLANNLINALFIDSKNNIWISTYEGGVTRYDGKSFTQISTKSGLPHDLVNCIFEDKYNRIWFGTRKGLVLYQEGKLTVYTKETGLSANDVRSIIEDGSGRMWIATYGGGISIFDGDTFSVFTTKEGLIQDHISLLFRDSKNNIWISTAFMGIIKYDGRALTSYTTHEGLGNNSIRSILEDRDGNMWFGNSNGNLTKFDGSSMRVYGPNDGLVAEAMRSSLQDRNGNIWFGTRGAGLVKFEGRLFSHYTQQEGIANSRISHISEDSHGNLWISTFGGALNILSEGVTNGIQRQYIRSFGPEAGLKGRFIFKTVNDSEGRIWIATDNNGLLMYDGTRTYTYDKSTGFPNNTVLMVDTDNHGNVWFSTTKSGVSIIKGEKIISYNVKNGLSSNHVRSFYQDSKDNLWIGTAGGGVTKYDGENFFHYNKKHGFFSDTINDIIEDNRGVIWLASGGNGLIRYDGKNFIKYSEESGLKNDMVVSLLQDRKGNIWAGTRFGLHEIKKRIHESIDTLNVSVKINSYGIEQGFVGMECRKEAMLEASDGTIWIGTEDRLTAYHGGTSLDKTITPELKISKVQLFNEDVNWSKVKEREDSVIVLQNGIKLRNISLSGVTAWYSLPENLKLTRKSNFITLHFIATTHSQIKNIRYQYMLEGVDKKWSSPTEKTDVSYAHLKHGKYNFRVKSISGEGVESNESNFSFSVKAAWWETIWVQTILVLLLLYSIYRFIQAQIETHTKNSDKLHRELLDKNSEIDRFNDNLEKVNIEKGKILSVISNDLRGPINNFISLTKSFKAETSEITNDKVKDYTDKILNSANSINVLMENLLQWSRIQQDNIVFEPVKVNIFELLNGELENFYKQAQNKNIRLLNKIPVKLEVEADQRMLRTILRNLISNAIKFTPRGGDVQIKADTKSKETISIIVADNGIGMTPDVEENLFTLNIQTGRSGTEGEPSIGLGLLICKYMARKHSGHIEVVSEIKKGSRFTLILPRKQPGNSE